MAKRKKTARRTSTRGNWTKRDVEILQKEFPGKSCKEVAKILGRPFYAVKRKAYRMGIYKSKRYLKSIGRL